MKNEVIDVLLNNLAASFCSDMNYIEDKNGTSGFVYQLLPRLFQKANTNRIIIRFPNVDIEPTSSVLECLLHSAKSYVPWIAEQMRKLDIQKEQVRDLILSFSLTSSQGGFECFAFCKDDRGKEHKVTLFR